MPARRALAKLQGCKEGGLGLSCCSATYAGCRTGSVILPYPPTCSYLIPGTALSPPSCRCSLDFCCKLLKKLKSFIRSASNKPRARLFTVSFGGANSHSPVSHFADSISAAEIRKFSFFFFNFPASEIPCCPSSFSFLHLRFITLALHSCTHFF